ncbi:hypothetical protein EON63_13665 [archaeon]|nr:MAG: hypothetical protein EON63_13665 [archaeon]
MQSPLLRYARDGMCVSMCVYVCVCMCMTRVICVWYGRCMCYAISEVWGVLLCRAGIMLYYIVCECSNTYISSYLSACVHRTH